MLCTGVMVLRLHLFTYLFKVQIIRTSLCTGVIVLRLLFIFNSEMEYNTLSQRCGRLYFSIFLFRVGLFTLMYMASLIALAILWPSLPMILKFSTAFVWLMLFWCSKIGDGAFKCSLYLSPNVLIYSNKYNNKVTITSE